ncbi:chemotaxis protein MotB [Georgenia satyanarayanai]|uniref:Chemotaxis protein MotB n=1 Tax=Georgenia satyanarayanai TaxID=860221 RepID=A0A2Y9BWM1_9MICO|nr:flagellar motor protein MotB [Georgenia satyanarayanai]PYG01063.1 chemotaxis protein MotB [Georgenia satyanarayanai]SSA39302.1 chemotaxis protein MotB [Georgenia satyanarayanai]
MSSRRRRGGHEEEEEENSERWTVSYMDMVTVMMCLFIVLFAISQVDQVKFNELRESLAAGFGDASASVSVVDGSSGVLDGADTPSVDVAPVDGAAGISPLDGNPQQLAQAEARNLDAVRESIRTELERAGLEDEVRFAITERGLVIGLVSENTFFSPASAAMPRTSLEVVDTIAATLRPLDNDILLEGHANPLPYTEPYETNWELSADRATKVLRRMVEHEGIAPTRVRAIGYGDAYPAAEGPDALDLNRRVDVVVLSNEPETVRTLLPEAAHDMEGA